LALTRFARSVRESPNCNPYAERSVKTIQYECLNQFIFFGERHPRHVVKDFMGHYSAERFHQGLGGRLIQGRVGFANDNGTTGAIVCRSRLGGMLNFYCREAA
jgi:putative transposase